MKAFTLSFLFFVGFSFIVTSQENVADIPIEYPFGEPGKTLERGFFGKDDRKEVIDAIGIKDFVRATAVMIPKQYILGNKVYGFTLREILTKTYGSENFDDNIKFLDQPTCASCTGFLIAPDILVTAGHCVLKIEDAEDYVWLFDYTNELKYNENKKFIEIDLENVYETKDVLSAYDLDDQKIDYSVLRLDRKSDRAPYRFRTSGKIVMDSKVNTIGSPSGLPLKFADNAVVVGNSESDWFKSDIDIFPGNSGGPIFSPYGFIEGIVVRGTVEFQNGVYTGDYKYDINCDCITTVHWESTFGTAGSQSHRITSIPYEIHHEAIYENIVYAISNNIPTQWNSWLKYNWIVDHEYSEKRGRLEFIAAQENDLEALRLILEIAKKNPLDKQGQNLLFYRGHFFSLTDLVSFLAIVRQSYFLFLL